MTMQPGKNVLLKIEDPVTPGTYLTVGGLQTTNMSFNTNLIDVTTKDSGGFQELLRGGGRRFLGISGVGLYTGSASELILRDAAINRTASNYRIEFGSGEIISGAFMIGSYERNSDQDSEELYSISLSSSGTFTFS